MSISQINSILSVLASAGQILIVLFLFYLLFFRRSRFKLAQAVINRAIPLAFLVALVATGSSLYYSEIAKFIPCDLCWFQRIFIYPQVILLGLAWLKRDNKILDYSLALIGVGTIISLYHNYIYYSAQPSNFCSIVAPCTQQYVVGLGYMSIPLLSLTAFILIGLLLIGKKYEKI